MELKAKLKIEDLVKSPNIAESLDEEDLNWIASEVYEGYISDRLSRIEWEMRTADSLKLALQVVEKKSFPWPNASNVKFPLVTIAAMQFHARAYPALVDAPFVCKTMVLGEDPDGVETARGKRISGHMNYQMFQEDESWEEQMDRGLLALPIVGCIFKKTYFDTVAGINRSVLVLPDDLVVDYYAKDLTSASRVTHVLKWNKNTFVEKLRSGIFTEVEITPPQYIPTTQIQEARDKAQGTNDNETKPSVYTILLQRCLLDFDGDGYSEPYNVWLREDTKEIIRIVAMYYDQGDVHRKNDASVSRFKGLLNNPDYASQKEEVKREIERLEKDKSNKIVRITAIEEFTKYGFIPSPDGGFYDIGYGSLLGPINASVDSAINQMIDAGTMSNTAGGFLGRGVKIKKGQTTFDPFEWKPVDSSGDDIRKNIFPLPVREPSNVLFQLLSLLVNYAERISGSVDIMVGQNPGQNTPAETSRTMVEQGSKIFSGIYKRVRRSLSEELKKWYRLNQLYLEEQTHFMDLSTGKGAFINQNDYTKSNIQVIPCADPNITSDAQKINQAMLLAQRAATVPGYNHYEVEKRIAEANKIQGFDILYPDPKGPNAIKPPVPLKIQQEQIKAETAKNELETNAKLRMGELMQEAQVNQAKIQKLEAEAIKALADAQGVESGHNIALLEMQISMAKSNKESVLKTIEIMQRALEGDRKHELDKRGMDRMESSSSD